jgi:hypothetical protein
MTSLAALFRVPVAREPASTLEQRVARLEKRIVWLEEQIDEVFYRQNELDAAMERPPLQSSDVKAA